MEEPLDDPAESLHRRALLRRLAAFGSCLFLGEIYLSLALEPIRPGPITAAVPALPRGLPDGGVPGTVSGSTTALHLVLTIEHKGMIQVELAGASYRSTARRLPRRLPVNDFTQTARSPFSGAPS